MKSGPRTTEALGAKAQAPSGDKPHSDEGSGWRGSCSVVKVQGIRFVRCGEPIQLSGTIDSFCAVWGGLIQL